MSNSAYRETFQKIKRVKDSNISLLNTMIQSVTTFTGKINKLIQNLNQISNELPTKKPKRKNPFFRQDTDDKYEVPDQDFTPTWNLVTNGFVNKPHGMQELSDLMRDFFIDKLKTVIQSYSESYSIIETTFQNALASFDPARERYMKAVQNFNSLTNKIDQLNEKLKPENTNGKNPEAIDKLRSQLTDAKGDLPSAEIEVNEAAEAFNEANLNFSITSEKMLSQFEKFDQEHEKQVRDVFTEFFTKYPDLKTLKIGAATEIKKIVSPTSNPPQVRKFENESLANVTVTPNFPTPSFDISSYIDPSEVFNAELLQRMATVTSTNIPFFPQGTSVVVTSESSKDYTIADIINLKSAVVKKTDIQIERSTRSIAQLKEDFTVQTATNSFEWKANEFLLITPLNNLIGQTVWCTDMYGRSGEVPFNKLNTK